MLQGAEVDSLVVRETPRYSALTVESPTPGTDAEAQDDLESTSDAQCPA